MKYFLAEERREPRGEDPSGAEHRESPRWRPVQVRATRPCEGPISCHRSTAIAAPSSGFGRGRRDRISGRDRVGRSALEHVSGCGESACALVWRERTIAILEAGTGNSGDFSQRTATHFRTGMTCVPAAESGKPVVPTDVGIVEDAFRRPQSASTENPAIKMPAAATMERRNDKAKARARSVSGTSSEIASSCTWEAKRKGSDDSGYGWGTRDTRRVGQVQPVGNRCSPKSLGRFR